MMKPAFSITVGSDSISAKERKLVSLRVKRSMGLPIDSCEIKMSSPDALEVEGKEMVEASLGYEDKLEKVFAGALDKVEYDIRNLTLTGLGPFSALLKLKTKKVYSNQTAGKIVKDLAKEAEIEVKEASDGINLPIYSLDDKINAFKHILKLAKKCNFDIYSNEQGQLIFRSWVTEDRHTVEYGKDIMSASCLDTSPRYGSTEIRGESPSSSKGSHTITWLTKQNVLAKISGGGGGNPLIINDPTIKDTKTAQSVAKARAEKMKYKMKVTLDLVGRAEIKLGDVVDVNGTPNSSLNGEIQVTGVEHYLSKTKGFTTTVTGRKKGAELP